ncbi:nucleotidyl transferase AbiEii/AbiGii toxin family protein [Rhizobium leguminosarum]|uniref:nucleotidyl transferase AbiEii/AbiGii toxin family protein n=1 Tax=Rhizobium leguminosarum TaxID=384 RepID=UPI002E15F85B|nr:nucleotidyl transferase AbiEii/AbiGii toxin family protein [Rhizobium leguminosarum]
MSDNRQGNKGASLMDSVRKEAKARKRDVQAEAQSYAIRRFIARLSVVDAQRRVTIKGGQGMGLLFGNDRRPTKDLDINIDCKGITDPHAFVREIIMAACDGPDDGVFYAADTIRIEERRHQGLGGFRIEMNSSIHTCRTNFVIDVGIGNDMSFKPIEFTLAERHKNAPPAVPVQIYPLEATFAEKTISKVEDGAASIRHKDFWDLWHIHEVATRIGDVGLLFANTLDLDDETLAWRDQVYERIKDGTFLELPQMPVDEDSLDRFGYALYRSSQRRGTEIPDDLVAFLRAEFGDHSYQSTQFGNWIKNQKQRLINLPPGAEDGPKELALGRLLGELEHFLQATSARAAAYLEDLGPVPYEEEAEEEPENAFRA